MGGAPSARNAVVARSISSSYRSKLAASRLVSPATRTASGADVLNRILELGRSEYVRTADPCNICGRPLQGKGKHQECRDA
jgi:hypothetical protein